MNVILDFHTDGSLSFYYSLSATQAENPNETEGDIEKAVIAAMERLYPDDEETLSVKGWGGELP